MTYWKEATKHALEQAGISCTEDQVYAIAKNMAEMATIRLGNGDVAVTSVAAPDGTWAGVLLTKTVDTIGIGKTVDLGAKYDYEINTTVKIQSTEIGSLDVFINRLAEARYRMIEARAKGNNITIIQSVRSGEEKI